MNDSMHMVPAWFPGGVADLADRYPALLVMGMAGGRYLAVCGALFMLACAGAGRPASSAPALPGRGQIGREMAYSMLTVLIIGVVNGAVLIGAGLIGYSRLYMDIGEHGWPWFWCSVVLMLLAHDTQFYWMHRLLHTRALFHRVHRVHHRSRHPSAWAAYSFHPVEAVLEVLIGVSIIFVIPVHPLAFMAFQTISTVLNAYGHSGREWLPVGWERHWCGRWLNTSSAHAAHHRHARRNFGLYFLFWDYAMGTLQLPNAPTNAGAAEKMPSLAVPDVRN